jgi:hypothetical protein
MMVASEGEIKQACKAENYGASSPKLYAKIKPYGRQSPARHQRVTNKASSTSLKLAVLAFESDYNFGIVRDYLQRAWN